MLGADDNIFSNVLNGNAMLEENLKMGFQLIKKNMNKNITKQYATKQLLYPETISKKAMSDIDSNTKNCYVKHFYT